MKIKSMNKIGNVKAKNILFLQGPMGNFFQTMDLVCREYGANTFKIGLSAGDQFFSNTDNYIPYRGEREDWQKFINDFFEKKKIDILFLLGDCRFYQSIAIHESTNREIDVFVFEEGYIRPDFITMEHYGVNDFSLIPRDPDFYNSLDTTLFKEQKIVDANAKFYRMGWSATTYYLLSALFWFRYPHYQHHRKLNLASEFFFGIRNAIRKYKYMITERAMLPKLLEQKNNYYFVPLQTCNDFQIIEHSEFSSVESFIETIIDSFASHAPQDTYLVIKHHPMDRGRKDYRSYIETLAKNTSTGSRVICIYDLHLPTCLKNAMGTITINSTVGISSLYHHTPTLVMGNAIYMELDDFWRGYKVPDRELFTKFRKYLMENTQLNGSFYGKFPTLF